jgi:7-cyano-7-deazaguanine synthase
MDSHQPKAIVILSGGLDSTTCMAVAREEGYALYPVTFAYGQKHSIELESARKVAEFYHVSHRHRIADLHGILGGSALTDDGKAIPLDRTGEQIAADIPSTYVPARNTVFLSIALAHAERLGAEAIYLGVNALDYSGYPDCRPAFIEAFQRVIDTGTVQGAHGRGIRIQTPLLGLSKADIVRLGTTLGAPLALTHSCYLGTRPACGRCDSCVLRIKGFAEAGIPDPIPYRVPVPWDS